ncbi:hypothetical protein QYE76_055835 [Lolium multiflorum]|uniref:4-hydroxy-7-methoxy-3-oxo-3,4-dihydro-2H-1,4-benzoxazin-2-yl glucosidebeta-D-glucosidase n=1 Tax=Lolium multiflorum TaxID=4521 RepID=A0AAD8WMN4_LOLMU|nr:hypothetical protein QYE76_055835 [Lolium multiflorum]
MGGATAFFFFLLLPLWVQDATAADLVLTRIDFPRDFVFGAGTSAYQYEGAVDEDGRSPSIWDTFTHAGKIEDKSTGDVAADGYHKYMEDVKLMYEIGLEAYRFSISWSRLIPNGRGAVNPKGLKFYNKLISELVNHAAAPTYRCSVAPCASTKTTTFRSRRPDVPPLALELQRRTNRPPATQAAQGNDRRPRLPGPPPRLTPPIRGRRLDILQPVRHGNIARQAKPPPPREGQALQDDASKKGSDETVAVARTGRGQSLDFHPESMKPSMQEEGPRASSSPAPTESGKAFTRSTILPKRPSPAVQSKHAGQHAIAEAHHPVVVPQKPKSTSTRPPLQHHVPTMLQPLGTATMPVAPRPPSTASPRKPRGRTRPQPRPPPAAARPRGKPNQARTNPSGPARAALRQPPPAAPPAPWPATTTPARRQASAAPPARAQPPVPVMEASLQILRTGSRESPPPPSPASLGFARRLPRGATRRGRWNGADVRGYFAWSFMDVFEFLSGYQSKYGLYHVDFADERRPRRARLSARWYSAFLKKKKAGTSTVLSNQELDVS